jgi:hypothetical protein
MKKHAISFLSLFFLLSSVTLFSQTIKLSSLKEEQVKVVNRELTRNPSDGSVKLSSAGGEGLAWLKGVEFSTGTIELDLRGKDVLQESFIGIAFHVVNDSTFEGVYFRPFNFHAQDPVRKIHAVQYIFHPKFPWYTLRETQNGIFEKEIPNAPDPNGWFHARIVVTDKEVLVYVDKATTPCLKVSRLSPANVGGVALWVGNGSDGEFANLSLR